MHRFKLNWKRLFGLSPSGPLSSATALVQANVDISKQLDNLKSHENH
jgi:hypothetical protein